MDQQQQPLHTTEAPRTRKEIYNVNAEVTSEWSKEDLINHIYIQRSHNEVTNRMLRDTQVKLKVWMMDEKNLPSLENFSKNNPVEFGDEMMAIQWAGGLTPQLQAMVDDAPINQAMLDRLRTMEERKQRSQPGEKKTAEQRREERNQAILECVRRHCGEPEGPSCDGCSG